MRLRLLLALAIAIPLAAAACGGGSNDEDTTATVAPATTAETTAPATTGAATTEATTTEAAGSTVPAQEWASSVCGALTTWQGALTASPPDVSNLDDLDAAKQELSSYFDRVVSASDTLVSDVEASGIPDVDQGEAIATDMQTALASVRDSFDEAKSQVDSLSTDDPAGFAASLQDVSTALTDAGDEATTAIEDVGSQYPAASDAFASAPECTGLGA